MSASEVGKVSEALVEQFPGAVFAASSEGRLFYWNAGAIRLFGFTEKQTVGRSLLEIFPAPRQAEGSEGGWETVHEKGAVQFESVVTLADGSLAYVDVTAWSFMEPGRGRCLALLVQDVSASRSRREGHALTARLNGVLDVLPDGILISNRIGRVVYVNVQAKLLFGFGDGELLGQPLERLVPERFRTAHAQKRKGYQMNPHTRPMGLNSSLVGLRKDGSEFPVEVSLSPLETGDGSMVIAAIRDVTERKRAEQELRQANEDLVRLEQERQSFLHIVSHEMRNPLAALKGLVTIALRRTQQGNGDVEHLLAAAEEQVGQLTSLAGDVVAGYGAKGARLSFRMEEIDLAEVLRASVRPYQLRSGNLKMMPLPDGAVPVMGDRRRLEEIFSNLLANATKYTPDGASITVTLTLGDGSVQVCVEDEGIGIEPADLQRVFDPFYRAANAVKQVPDGHGLGLYISREIARYHGGDLRAEPRSPRGTRLVLQLPVKG